MMREFIQSNFDIVFLLYGFFFVFMGLSIVVQQRQKSDFSIAKIIWLLAAFGIIHGFNEWLDMISFWRPHATVIFHIVRHSFLFVSYAFLLEFGRRLVGLSRKSNMILSKWLTVILSSLCLAGIILSKAEQTIWCRYFLGLPGGMLTSVGFISYYHTQRKVLDQLKTKKYFYSLFLAFAFYAILGGFFTTRADFFPASVFNYANFINYSGIPIQVFRGFCAAIAAWGIWHVLGIFNWEYSQKLLEEIKKRKKVEKELRLFRDLLDQSNDAVFIIDPLTSKFLDCNTKVREVLGYTHDEIFKLGVIDIEANMPSLGQWKEHIEVLKKRNVMLFEGVHVRKDGTSFPVEVSIKYVLMPEGDYIISVARDISERKQAQEYFKKLFDKASEGIFILNDEGMIVAVNEAFASMHGYSIEEMLKMGLNNLDEPETAKLSQERLQRVKSGESIEFEVGHYHKDGHIIFLEAAANSILIENKKLIIGFHRDITERKKTERSIKKQKEFIELVINALEYPFYVINTDYTIALANKVAKEKGVTEFARCYKVTHRSDTPCEGDHACPLREVVATRKSVKMEHIHFDKFGNERIVEVHGDPIFNSNGKIVQMIEYAIDVTERRSAEKELSAAYEKIKQTQEELIQTGKMAAMGQMAAGISHELNQPLTGIKGLAQYMLKNQLSRPEATEDLHDIINQADRMDKIITNVRFFARKAEFKLQEVDINQPIEDAVKLLKGSLKLSNIVMKKKLADNLPKIKGDDNQLQQVFINLITNAKDAICQGEHPRKGNLKIATFLSDDKSEIAAVFEDSGCGIPKTELKDIFNPFFTTKSPDGGMGLGLSIVYRIIKNHKGRIEIESVLNKGTKVKISLPIYKKKGLRRQI